MRYRWLASFPILLAIATLAIASTVFADPASADALGRFTLGLRFFARFVAVLGCFAAMSVFERGEGTYRGWALLAFSSTLTLVRDLLYRLVFHSQETPMEQGMNATLVVVSNLAQIVAVFLLARAWRAAAIGLAAGSARTRIVTIAIGILALVVVGPAILGHTKTMAGGDFSALPELVASIVDLLSFFLIAPILLTALSLRGSSFSWPCALLAACLASWLFYDAADVYGQGATWAGVKVSEIFRHLALNFLGAAGLAQAWVVRGVRRVMA